MRILDSVVSRIPDCSFNLSLYTRMNQRKAFIKKHQSFGERERESFACLTDCFMNGSKYFRLTSPRRTSNSLRTEPRISLQLQVKKWAAIGERGNDP